MKRKRAVQTGDLISSSEHGQMCPGCEQPIAACACTHTRNDEPPAGDGVVRISRQTRGRKGKGVTLVTGLPLRPSELPALAKRLKQICGSGGAVKDGVIEIQGDHRDQLVAELQKRGWTVKRSGG